MTVPWQHRRVRLPWGRLSVQVAGSGPPLLLLHGLGGSGRYWAGLGPLLAETRTLISPDLAGFGRSDKPSIDYTRDFHVETIEALLAQLNVEGGLDIAGHSMGGILAALFAARHPEKVESLAIVASPFPRTQMHPFRVPRGVAGKVVYRTLQRLLPLVSPVVRSPVFPRAVIADYLRHTLDSYQRTSHALIWDPSVADEFVTLDRVLSGRPQLLLYSDEDTTIGADNLERWRAVLPHAEVVVIPGAHQLLLRDHFATLADWYQARAQAAPEPVGR
jgi:pimeloyl-ACP methyl ester carboxylesterase